MLRFQGSGVTGRGFSGVKCKECIVLISVKQ